MRVMTAPKIWLFWFSARLTPGGAGPKSPLADIVAFEGVARKIVDQKDTQEINARTCNPICSNELKFQLIKKSRT